MRITVLGGGNGSYAAAADLAGLGHDVTLWRRDRQALQAVLATRRLTLKDVSGVRDVILSRVTADIGKAVRGAELIVVPTPAFAQEDMQTKLLSDPIDGAQFEHPLLLGTNGLGGFDSDGRGLSIADFTH